MSAKTEVVRARIDPELKHTVSEILKNLGLNPTEAINMFYRQIAMQNGLPFEVKIPNKATKKAIKDVKLGKNLNYAKDKEDFFKQLED